MIFVTSDTHFYHNNIIRYDNLPFDNPEEMNEKIITEWNKRVQPCDEVYHLGDVFFCGKEDAKAIMDRLNGTKHLIMGNHDKHGVQWFYDVGFETVSKHPIILDSYVQLSHYPPEYTSEDRPNLYLYGHVHNSPDYLSINRRSACVCCSRWGYAPIMYDTIIKAIQRYDKRYDEIHEMDKKLIASVINVSELHTIDN